MTTEATSIAVIAWLNDQSQFSTNSEKAMKYILAQVEDSSYGSTQATILALKAITAYMEGAITINGAGKFEFLVDGVVAMEIPIDKNTKESIEFDLTEYIKENKRGPFDLPYDRRGENLS